mmetsp:Transcript_20923/g.31928  ORF Transcript_20923/g.31928 Transcript_20923/m.31928 type:complete len:239 (+) Transcript_20923:1127-1843(+)
MNANGCFSNKREYIILGVATLLYAFSTDNLYIVASISIAVGLVLALLRFVIQKKEAVVLADNGTITTASTTTTTSVFSINVSILADHIGHFIALGAVTDTGIPQQIYSALLGGCKIFPSSVPCIYLLGFLLFVQTNILTSPLATVQVFFCTFPYANPYEVLQVALVVGLSKGATPLSSGYHAAAAAAFVKESGIQYNKVEIMMLTLASSLFSVMLGMKMLEMFHFAPECSEKLGECEY